MATQLAKDNSLLALSYYLGGMYYNDQKNTQQHNTLVERFKDEMQKDQIFLLNQEKIIEENRFNLLVISFLVSIIFIIIVLFFYQTIKKQKVEIEEINQNLEVKIEERTRELKQAYDEIKEAMLNGQTIERKRVTADLHDNLGSILSATGLSLETLDKTKLGSNEQVIFEQIKHQISNDYQELRLLSHNLQPEKLEKYGLKNTFEKLQEKITTNHKIKFSLSIDNLETLSKVKAFNLYMICLELVNNTLKYANATEIMLSFCKNGMSK